MATSEDDTLRAIAASHPRLPSNRLLALLVDDTPGVRRAAVKNTAITPPMLEIATHDEDAGIAAYARMILGGMKHDRRNVH